MSAAVHSERKRRPRRVAADEAHAWARNLRLGNPYAKLVLSMLTLYVNGEGSCFVSVAAIADDCELAVETVRRRLAWLETVGAITKLPQWVDEHGRRNSDGRGRRTSDDIRLMIQSDPDEIEARAHGNGDDGGSGGADVDPVREKGVSDGAPSSDPPASPLATPSLRTGAESSEPEHEPEDSPLPPKGGEPGPSGDFEGKKAASWQRFESAWSEPILRQSIARQVWAALSETEQDLAIRAARGYFAHRKAQRKPPNVINAHTFLREREAWPGFADRAPPEPKAPPPMVQIQRGSLEWRASIVAAAIAGERSAGASSLRAPLATSAHTIAEFADEQGRVNVEAWRPVPAGTAEFAAWAERAAEWWPHRIEAYRIRLQGPPNVEDVLGIKVEKHPMVYGLLAPPTPTGFPPAKHGQGEPQGSATGPPTIPALTEEDREIIANFR